MKMKTILLVTLMVNYALSTVLDTSGALLSRQKRTLIFEPGLNWIQMVVGVGLPVEIKDHSITWGAALKSYYEVPNNSSAFTQPSIDVARGKRSTSRWKLYSALQNFAENFGFKNSKACILRIICECASIPFDGRSGLMSEILHLLFTPSSTNEFVESHYDYEYHAAERLGNEEKDCVALFPECDADFMTQFTTVFTQD